jgi:hypothetical protein
MDLRTVCNQVSSTVNQNTAIAFYPSTGFTTGAGARQVPSYGQPIRGFAQTQGLSWSDLKQIDGLNLQGTLRAIYFRGNMAGVITPKSKGGDLVKIGNDTWLVVKVLEIFPNYTKAVICLQGETQ